MATLPQRIPLTQDGKLISKEWGRALDDLDSRVESIVTAAPAPAPASVTYSRFVGDMGFGGASGLVPAPLAGDGSKYLKGDGTWSDIPDLPLGDAEVNTSFSQTHRVLITLAGIQYWLALEAVLSFELREDGSFELREDGFRELRG